MYRFFEVVERVYAHPRQWPRWLRHTYLITMPISVPLHMIILIVGSVMAALVYVVLSAILWAYEVWTGTRIR